MSWNAPTALRVPVATTSPGSEADARGDEGDQIGDRADHHPGVVVLHRRHRRPGRRCGGPGVLDLVDGDVRTDRRRALHRLAGEPVDQVVVADLQAELEVPGGRVVEERIARDVVERLVGFDVASGLANDRRQFGLVVDPSVTRV